MADKRLQGAEQFHLDNCLLKMSCSHAKMRLKSAPQNLKFAMKKAISKRSALDCSFTCPCMSAHSYT